MVALTNAPAGYCPSLHLVVGVRPKDESWWPCGLTESIMTGAPLILARDLVKLRTHAAGRTNAGAY